MEFRDLDHGEKQLYLAALSSSHRIRTAILVYDRDEQVIEKVVLDVVGGQVDADLSQTPTRRLSLTVLDPNRKLPFQPGTMYADNMLGVEYGVEVPDLGWVDTPVFFGPMSRYARDGDVVTLEAQGKEAMLIPPFKWTIPADPPNDRVLRTVIRELALAAGEKAWKIRLGAGRSKRVPGPNQFRVDPAKARSQGLWWYMSKIAESRNFLLSYSPSGHLELRRMNPAGPPTYTFDNALTEPAVSYAIEDVRNRVEVRDLDTKDRIDPLVRLDLPAGHPLSKESLARSGKDHVLLERIDVDEVKMTIADAERVGAGVLRKHSAGALEVQFEHLPIPHLELGDKVRLRTDTVDEPFILRAFTLPLTSEDSMSVGYTRRVRYRKKFRYRLTRLKK